MKRALLLGAGTIVGTAAVLAYHPGSLFGTGSDAAASPAFATGTTAPAAPTADAPTVPDQASVPTQAADATSQPAPLSDKATTSKKSTASSSQSQSKAQSQAQSQSQSKAQSQAQAQPQTPAAAPPPAPAPGTSGTFTGAAVQTRYGAVQVQITVDNGKVTGAVGQQAATDGRSQMIASVAIPRLEQQAVAAQSANINGVSGASYTSGGFARSLQSALQQAGLG